MEVDDESVASRFLQACQDGDLVAADALWREGVDVNYVGVDGRTPLLAACAAGSLTLVSALSCASADVDACDSSGRGAALLAAESGCLELLEWLCDQGFTSLAECADDGSTALLCAATGGSTPMLSWLLDGPLPPHVLGKPSLEERDTRGANCAHCAAEAGELLALQEVLRRGAAVDAVDDQGCSILHYAAGGGHVEVVKFCVKKLKMNSSVQDSEGDTPLLVAAFEGHTEVVEWLLKNGSSVQERNHEGMSAALAAAAGEHPDVIEILNRCGGSDGEHWMEEVMRHPELVLNILDAGDATRAAHSSAGLPNG